MTLITRRDQQRPFASSLLSSRFFFTPAWNRWLGAVVRRCRAASCPAVGRRRQAVRWAWRGRRGRAPSSPTCRPPYSGNKPTLTWGGADRRWPRSSPYLKRRGNLAQVRKTSKVERKILKAVFEDDSNRKFRSVLVAGKLCRIIPLRRTFGFEVTKFYHLSNFSVSRPRVLHSYNYFCGGAFPWSYFRWLTSSNRCLFSLNGQRKPLDLFDLLSRLSVV